MQSNLSRSNLAYEVESQLRSWIIDGYLSPQERLNEVHLAAQLGVSRTPLREALTTLAAEGFVESVPRRGFFVTRLSVEEFRQLYKMRAILDPAALEDAGLPSAQQVVRLEQLNRELAASNSTEQTIELDDDWHLTLLNHCSNEILIDLIRQFIRKTRRYEHAYLRQQAHVQVALDEHERILAAIRRGDLAAACAALRQNMSSGHQPLLDWLRKLESTNR